MGAVRGSSPSVTPALRTRSVDEMGPVAYRKYLDSLGRLSRYAKRRFLAELPEVASRDLARRWGFESVHVFAAKVAGMSRGVVNEILGLHEALGEHEALWARLRSGEVGWSKLKAIKKVVTKETASWWAEKVVGCSLRQIEEEVRELTRGAGQERAGQSAGALRGARGANQRAPRGRRGSELPGPARRNLETESGAASGAGCEADQDRGTAAPRAVALQDLDCEAAEVEAEDRPRDRRPPRLTVHLSDAEMALLEALRDQQARRTSRATSLNDVVRWAIRTAAAGTTSGFDSDANPGGLGETAKGAGSARSAGGKRGVGGTKNAEDAEDTEDAEATKASPSPPASSPIPAMLVLYRNQDSGEIRIPTRHGLVPAELDEGSPLITEAKTVQLSDLVDQAASTQGKPGSRYVPVAHQRLVAARYGNRCGFPGCLERAGDLHHFREAVAEGGRSHADNLVPLCGVHHDAAHSGWIQDGRAAPEEWRFLEPGEVQGSRPVDAAYLAHRGAALAGTSLEAEVPSEEAILVGSSLDAEVLTGRGSRETPHP